MREPLSRFTRPFNYLGWPAIAIGGLQIAGRDGLAVLAAALAWDEAYGPPLREQAPATTADAEPAA